MLGSEILIFRGVAVKVLSQISFTVVPGVLGCRLLLGSYVNPHNREADQRLCFLYYISTIPALPISKISRF